MSDLTVGSRQIVILNRDLFFGVRLKQLGTDLGYSVVITTDAVSILDAMNRDEPVLGIIDINAGPDWALLAASTHAIPMPTHVYAVSTIEERCEVLFMSHWWALDVFAR